MTMPSHDDPSHSVTATEIVTVSRRIRVRLGLRLAGGLADSGLGVRADSAIGLGCARAGDRTHHGMVSRQWYRIRRRPGRDCRACPESACHRSAGRCAERMLTRMFDHDSARRVTPSPRRAPEVRNHRDHHDQTVRQITDHRTVTAAAIMMVISDRDSARVTPGPGPGPWLSGRTRSPTGRGSLWLVSLTRQAGPQAASTVAEPESAAGASGRVTASRFLMFKHGPGPAGWSGWSVPP